MLERLNKNGKKEWDQKDWLSGLKHRNHRVLAYREDRRKGGTSLGHRSNKGYKGDADINRIHSTLRRRRRRRRKE